MIWRPISNTVPQYDHNDAPASGYYLKFYAANTVTPISMATDASGGTTLAKCQLDTDGFTINGSGDPFVPHVDQDYRIVLYPTSADADADNTAAAIFNVAELKFQGNAADVIDGITALKAITPVNDEIYFLAYHTTAGDGGHGHFRGITGASPGTYTDNNFNIILPTGGDGSTAFVKLEDIADGITALRGKTPLTNRLVVLRYHTNEGDNGYGVFRSVTGAAPSTYTDDGGTIILPSGGDGSAAFLRENVGDIHAEWFGVQADGSTDDSTALTSAYSAAASLKSRLILPGGTIALSSSIFWSSSLVDVQGQGAGNPGGSTSATVLDFANNTTLYIGRSDASTIASVFKVKIGNFAVTNSAAGSTSPIVQIAADRSSIYDLHIDGGSDTVIVEQATQTTFDTITIKNGTNNALLLQPQADSYFVTNNVFSMIDCRGAGNYGISLADAALRAVGDNTFIAAVCQANANAVSDNAGRTVWIKPHFESNTTLNGIAWGAQSDENKVFGANVWNESGTRPAGAQILVGTKFLSQSMEIYDGSALALKSVNDWRVFFDYGDTNQQIEISKGSAENLVAHYNTANYWSFSPVVTVEGNALLVVANGVGGTTAMGVNKADGSGFNGAATAMILRANSSTSRSLNAAGTLNASGADMAEYMLLSKHLQSAGSVKKGDVLGVDINGNLTDVFDDVVGRFYIKSTSPHVVGGDSWFTEEAPVKPEQPKTPNPHSASEIAKFNEDKYKWEEDCIAWEAEHASWYERLESERVKYDRMAKSGMVPVNINATSQDKGKYLVPEKQGQGITARLVDKVDLTLSDYIASIGWVMDILPDGRPLVEVKVS